MGAHQLFHIVIKVNKEDSAFLYFTLESNEGLGFYSTLPHKEGDAHRNIEIKGSISLRQEILQLLTKLEESFPIEYLKNEIIEDKI